MARDEGRRHRVSRDQVKDNARQSGGSGARLFNLPKGVSTWAPDKAESYVLDFLPYETQSETHPDRLKPGTIWYKFPFQVHKNVGPAQDTVVCPVSIGKRCPICEQRRKLDQDKADEEQIKALRTQGWTAFVIKHPDEKGQIAVFALSNGKFWNALKKELDEDKNGENAWFYDVVDGNGRTLTCRFSKATFSGREYLECTRIDFRERKDMDEDTILKQTPCLDGILNVMSYDRLNALFYQLDEDGENTRASGDGKDGEDEDGPPSRTTSGSKAGKSGTSAKSQDVDEDDEPVQKLAELKAGKGGAKKPKFTEGDWVSFDDEDGDTVVGKIIDIDDEDVEVKDAAGKTHDTTLDKLSPAEEPAPKGKAGGKQAAKPKADEDEDADDDDSGGDAPKFKKGDRVRDDSGKVGKIVEIDGDDVKIKGVGGKTWDADVDDLTLEPEDDDTPPDTGDDDDDDNEDADAGDDADDDKEDAQEAFAVGESVAWDDGDESGVILKLKGDKARIKDSDGDEVTVPLAELSHAKKAKAKK